MIVYLPGAAKQKESLRALTGLRFFAAFFVVIYHFARPAMGDWPGSLLNIASEGYVAVSLFFLLSGFVLSYSYIGREGTMRGTRWSFWVARFARIYPAYLLAFFLAAPTNIWWTLHVNSLHTGISKLLTGSGLVLMLQQSWTPWTAWYWNFPAWSVSVEAFFYLTFPFIALRLARLNRRQCVFGIAGFWILGMLAPTALWLTGDFSAGPEGKHPLQMAVEFTPIFRLPEFLIGVLLGRLYILGVPLRPAVSGALAMMSSMAIFAVLAMGMLIPRPMMANGLLVPLFGLLIFTLAPGSGWMARFLSLGWIVLLGEASYGIYILQVPVAYVMHLPPPLHSLGVFGLYAMVLIGVSLLSMRFVETPLRKWLRLKLEPLGSSRRPAEKHAGIPLTISREKVSA